MNTRIDQFDWANDWQAFVESVAALHKPGVSSEDLTRHYVGTEIRWKGVVNSVKLDNDYHTHLGVSMPEHKCELFDGRIMKAGHMVIQVDEDQIDQWADCVVGATIEFQAGFGFFQIDIHSVSVYVPSGPGPNAPASLRLIVVNAKRFNG